ncbi:MAG TPA: ProQ/FinO family protein [Scandinavium sp.]
MDKNQRALMLRESWPSLFAQEPPKPMKTGIMQDLISDATQRQIDFPGVEIGKALKRYTRTIPYQLALANQSQRYGIHGEPDGVVTEEQRQMAVNWLNNNPHYPQTADKLKKEKKVR